MFVFGVSQIPFETISYILEEAGIAQSAGGQGFDSRQGQVNFFYSAASKSALGPRLTSSAMSTGGKVAEA
jgi:hypothetical protein